MPMDEEYKELLEGLLRRSPQHRRPGGGTITAAWFIRDFVDETPWVHLDIAGTGLAGRRGNRAWPKAATGVGLRTFVRLAETW